MLKLDIVAIDILDINDQYLGLYSIMIVYDTSIWIVIKD